MNVKAGIILVRPTMGINLEILTSIETDKEEKSRLHLKKRQKLKENLPASEYNQR